MTAQRRSVLKAVLCDLDGTLLDSLPLWFDAQRSLAREWGFSWTHHDAQATAGLTMTAASRQLQSRGVRTDVETINRKLSQTVADVLTNGHLPWMRGAEQLLDELDSTPEMPCALVTSTYRVVVASIPRLLDVFDVVVAGDEVTNGKPHPAPYLEAIEVLGVRPTQCIAIEDSISGAASAEQAGSTVLVVGQTLSARGQHHLDSLLGLTVERLEELHSSCNTIVR